MITEDSRRHAPTRILRDHGSIRCPAGSGRPKPAEITVTGMGRRPAALYGGVTAGGIVGIVVLIGATAFGLARRRSDGRLRRPRGQWPAPGRAGTGGGDRAGGGGPGRTLRGG